MSRVTESIYSGSHVVPLADVQHIEGRGSGNIMVVMRSTTWCKEMVDYNNGVYFPKEEAGKFKAAWCHYRSELEADTLSDPSPKLTPPDLTLNMIAALDALRDRMDAKRKEEAEAPPGHRYQLTFRQVAEEAGKPDATVADFRNAFRRYFRDLRDLPLPADQFHMDFEAGTVAYLVSWGEVA